MGLFSRNKNKNPEPEVVETPTWNKDLKRNTGFDSEVEQQGFDFQENIDTNSDSAILETKKGLSCNPAEITSDQVKILQSCGAENTAEELMKILGRSHKTRFKRDILNPLLNCDFLERTIPESPTSPKQKYRPTGKFVKPTSL